MPKYHLTKSGNPGVCKATSRCPLGGDDSHYPTKESARQAYELTQQLKAIPTVASVAMKKQLESNASVKTSASLKNFKEKLVIEPQELPYSRELRETYQKQNEREIELLRANAWSSRLSWLKSKEYVVLEAGTTRSGNKYFELYEKALIDETEAKIAFGNSDRRYAVDHARDEHKRMITTRHLDNLKAVKRLSEDTKTIEDFAKAMNVDSHYVQKTLDNTERWLLGKRNSPNNLQTLAKNPQSIGKKSVATPSIGSSGFTIDHVKETLELASRYSNNV